MVALLLAPGAAAQALGPGRGAWEVATPESQGLSADALRAADEATEAAMGSRVCYLVVKNGKIVHERYMGSGTVEGIRSAEVAPTSRGPRRWTSDGRSSPQWPTERLQRDACGEQ